MISAPLSLAATGYGETYPKADLEAYLNLVFGWQVNAWFNVTIRDQIHDVNYDLNNDGWLLSSDPDLSTSGEEDAIITAIPEDGSADIHIYLLNRGIADPGNPPLEPGEEVATPVLGVAPVGNHIFIAHRSYPRTPAHYIHGIAHEIGHVMIGPGHPDMNSGPAPLQGTDREGRLMAHKVAFMGRRLVKAEWDKIEEWLKMVPDKHWRDDHGIEDQTVPTGNY